MTSSLGRLFDAVAFLLGICDQNRYEAEAAMGLEALARRQQSTGPLSFGIREESPGGSPPPRDEGHWKGLWTGEPLRLDVRPMIRELVEKARATSRADASLAVGARSDDPMRALPAQAGRVGELARAFHETVAAMLVEAVRRVAKRSGLRRVALSGGCFANRLLMELMSNALSSAGLTVFSHRQVPTGDGGLALGQAVVAAERLRRTR